MCSLETNSSFMSAEQQDLPRKFDMELKHKNDTLSCRHRRQRRVWTELNQNFGSLKRSKLKCSDQSTLASSSDCQATQRTTTSSNNSSQLNSNRLVLLRKNVHTPLVIFSICLMVSLLLSSTSAFNVDMNSKVVHTAPRSTCDEKCMFGFSVAQHRENGQSWLLVGAPAADSQQPNVYRGGAVYKCHPDSPGRCEMIPFDREGNTWAPTGQQYDNKTGQWFGSLVRSSGEDGVVLACAPRYLWFSRNFKRREPVGMCFTGQDDFKNIQQHSPCRTRKWGYHRQGSCQAGLGAAIADDGNQMFIGAVGSWYWQGQVFSQNLLPNLRNVQHKTAEGSPSDDDSYLGYSAITGEFDGDVSSPDVAVGMPRGSDLKGKVVVYNANLTNVKNVTGGQIGAYFGYSLASGDLDGDGRDDLIIGAPMWTNYDVMGKYETGRVYVVYNGQPGTEDHFGQWTTLDGMSHKARFGLSVACAGNLNLDGLTAGNKRGIEDLIIGAPYDGPDHRGAIYVYLGSAERRASGQWKYAQVIYGKDVDSRMLTFGWSVSGGMDLDNNNYPDVLVGAYESANAIYFKSAPVVHLDSKLEFRVPGKNVDLEQRSCRLNDGTKVTCVNIDVSMEYDGVGVPDSIRLDLEFVLDAKKSAKSRRLFFLENANSKLTQQSKRITVYKGKKWTDEFKVYLPATTIHDKLTSIDVEVSYKLASQPTQGFGGRLRPVLGQAELKARDSISIQKDCGDDLQCIPDLSIQYNLVSGNYVIGKGDKMEISAIIDNKGEDAFNAMLYLQIPQGVNYISANSSSTYVSILCSNPKGSPILRCEIGNPFPANSQVEVRIFLSPDEKNQDVYREGYQFTMLANSSNPEVNFGGQDNEIMFTVPLQVESEVRVTGKSEPAQVEYNISEGYPDEYLVEDQIGQTVVHIYDVKNKGPSLIKEAEVYILWPSFTGNLDSEGQAEDLLYLLPGVEYDHSKVTCQNIKNINPRYIKTSGSKGYAEALIQAQEASNRIYTRESGGGYSYGGSSSGGSSSSSSWSYSESSSSSSGGSHAGGSSSSSSGSSNTGYHPACCRALTAACLSCGAGQTVEVYCRSNPGTIGCPEPVRGGKSSSSSNINTIMSAAKGPGDYHGTINQAELEREAGGKIFSSTDEETRRQIENTRYQGTFRGQGNRVASGATETRLTDEETHYANSGAGDGGDNSLTGGSGFQSSYDYEKSVSQTQGGSSSGSSSPCGFGCKWKLLENGTYIRVYNTKSTAEGRGQMGSSSIGHDSGNNYDTGSSDSGWVEQPDGSRRKEHSSWSSWSSSTGYDDGSSYNGGGGGSGLGNNYDTGNSDSGWVTMPDGSKRREQSSWSSTSSIENSGTYGRGSFGSGAASSSSRGTNRVSPSATETRLGGGSTTYEEGSYYDQDNRAKYDDNGRSRTGYTHSSSSSGSSDGGQNLFGSGYSSGSSSSSSSSSSSASSKDYGSSTGSWVWNQTAKDGKGEWQWTSTTTNEDSSPVTKTSGTQSGGGGYTSSDGTYRASSSSSGSNLDYNDRGYVVQPNGTLVTNTYASYDPSGGGRHRQNGRRTQSSRSREESSYGGVRLNSEDADEISRHFARGEVLDHNGVGHETGDLGKNSSGWIEQPDGTFSRKTSSWASWSKTGHSADDLDPETLNRVQQDLESKARSHLQNGNDPWPRTKRAIDFKDEIECTPEKCTLIQCTIGPMNKDDVVTFKIRSRLFTETQIKNFRKRVEVSSKMVTRITRLPYQADPRDIAPQIGRVTTEVFPSDMGEETIPWWVWLLAALGGLLLLALIVYCLYKCGFFKRKRPDDSPEREPLNSNGYH